MSKILVACLVLASLATGCASVQTTQLNGQTVVISTHAAPVIFTAIGAPLSKCLKDLDANGVTTVVDADGPNEDLLISRISGSESCQATGVK
jgi:uncharacterized protein YcfL